MAGSDTIVVATTVPQTHARWTDAEDAAVLELHRKLGTVYDRRTKSVKRKNRRRRVVEVKVHRRWSTLPQELHERGFPLRTEGALKKRWQTLRSAHRAKDDEEDDSQPLASNAYTESEDDDLWNYCERHAEHLWERPSNRPLPHWIDKDEQRRERRRALYANPGRPKRKTWKDIANAHNERRVAKHGRGNVPRRTPAAIRMRFLWLKGDPDDE